MTRLKGKSRVFCDGGRGRMQVSIEVVVRWDLGVSKGKGCEAGLFGQEQVAFIEILCLLDLLEPSLATGFYPQTFKAFPCKFPNEATLQRHQFLLNSDAHLPEFLPSALSLSVLGSLCHGPCFRKT